MKSLATSPPRKDLIPNKNKNTLLIKKYHSLPPHLPKFPPGFKSLRNEASNDHDEYIDTSRNDKDHLERTDKYEYIENLKSTNNKNSDGKYTEENSQHQHDYKSVIKKSNNKKH